MEKNRTELLGSDLKLPLDKLKNKTVLITGASGLVGLHMLSSLKKVQKELNVTIYTWTRNSVDLFGELFNDCNKITGDIVCDIHKIIGLPKFDVILHCAGYATPLVFLNDKIKTIEINTTTTIKLLEMLKEDGKFLFISSSEVYNGLFKFGLTENEIGITNTQHPRSAYIESKKCGEVICDAYREKGRDVKVARLSIAYGAGTKLGDTRVINSLIEKGINNDTIELMDDGSALRTFCYISDIVEMLWNITLNGKDFIYNIGGVHSSSIYELATKIGEKLNKKIVRPVNNNELVGNPKLVNLSIDKYIKEFGHKDFVSMDIGLDNTIEWQKFLNNERD